MLFEVYKDSKRMMYTEYEECIPSIDVIKKLKTEGYKFFLNGKAYKITKDTDRTKESGKKK